MLISIQRLQVRFLSLSFLLPKLKSSLIQIILDFLLLVPNFICCACEYDEVCWPRAAQHHARVRHA